MKKFILLILSVIFTISVDAKEIIVHQGDASFEITESNWTNLGFNLSIPAFDLRSVKAGNEIYSEIFLDGSNTSLDIGAPKLPVLNRLIETPGNVEFNVQIISSSYTDFDLGSEGYTNPIIPYQGPQIKTWDGDRPFSYDAQAYSRQGFGESELVYVEYVGEMRGVEVSRLSISPFSYNPSTHTLRVYHSLNVRIVFEEGDRQAARAKKEKFHSPAFESSHSLLWNYTANNQTGAENISSNGPVRMVIVADSMFKATLQPFIAWKKQKGFQVTEAYLQNPAVGSSSNSIKSYLQSLYSNPSPGNPAPSFIIFVGDIAQLPPFNTGGHVTDRDFCEYTNDALPEVYYGRFSAINANQLQIQLDKTIEYEKYLMQDPGFLDDIVLIAGADASFGPTHGNGQINYGTSTYFNTAHGLNTDAFLYPASSGNAALIRQKVGAGVGIANYTAHGNYNGWADPSFNTGHVNSMSNGGRYPLMIGNACLTNKFNASNPCFGEALLRAPDKGAIGYIGASNNTYWDEDFYWAVGVGTVSANPTYAGTSAGLYDLFVHNHNEPFNQWAMTQAQIMFAGNLAVTQAASSVNYYWEIYHLMGDPSLMPYLGVPSTMSVSYVPLLPLGVSSVIINAEPYSYVAISYNDSLYGAQLADSNGVAVVSLNAFTLPCQATVTVTAQNFQPWFGSITVATPNGPYIIYSEHGVDDSGGNSNGKADYGEPIDLDMDIMNLTSFSASSVDCKLRSNDPYITLIDTSHTLASVAGNDTMSVASMFSFKVDSMIPDGHTVSFTLFLSTTGANSWTSQFSVVLNAPNLELIALEINDATGNANGRLDAGESADIIVKAINKGHADAANTMLSIISSAWEVPIIGGGAQNYSVFISGDTITAVYPTQVAAQTPNGLVVQLAINLAAGQYTDQWQAMMMVGVVDEDFETGDFSKYAWAQGGNLNWTADQANVYEGAYSAKSGAIADQQETTMSIDMNVIADDSISFYTMVSSEAYYDFLEFYIDGTMVEQWSGSTNWERDAYAVDAGQHTFMWRYMKDYYLSDGQDCGWVDYIIFPPNDIFAGEDEKDPLNHIFNVWPNPASSMLNIEVDLNGTSANILLFDMSGRLVRSMNTPEGLQVKTLIQLSLEGLDSGLYQIVIQSDGMTQNSPVIISK